MGYVYVIGQQNDHPNPEGFIKCKIGVSQTPFKRLKHFQSHNADLLGMIFLVRCDNPYYVENALHELASIYRPEYGYVFDSHIHHEWYRIDGYIASVLWSHAAYCGENPECVQDNRGLWFPRSLADSEKFEDFIIHE